MAVRDHGIEVLKKSGEEVVPGNRGDYYIKVNDSINKAVLDAILAALGGSSGVITNIYGNVSSVASSTQTTIVTYTVPVGMTFELKEIEFSGENIAMYEVEIASSVEAKKRTYFGGNLFGEFQFQNLSLVAGTVINLKVTHFRPMTADFEGRIIGSLA